MSTSIKVRRFNSARSTRAFALAAVLVFWALSLPTLDRFPPIHNDEPTIQAPGYQLVTEGVYGLKMYTGFHGEDRLYLEVMPLMPLLQGVSARLFGVGVWPMRFLPVALSALTLALTFAIARQVAGRMIAALAVFLLLFWQWIAPQANPFLGSGIPLIDIARLARYDILVAPLGLAAWWFGLRARETQRPRDDFLSGLLAGLAGMANAYGAFWVVALVVLRLVERPDRSPRPVRSLASIILGASLPWVMWGAIVLSDWQDFQGQFSKHAYDGRLSFFDPAFYLNNLAHEIQRYSLGLRDPASYTRAGLWCLLVGVPLAWLWLAQRVRRGHDRLALRLLLPAAIMPALLALLVNKKSFYYLATVAPLFAMLLAWGIAGLWQSPRQWTRLLALIIVGLISLQGAIGVAHLQAAASRVASPAAFFAQLRRAVPTAMLIYGPHEYWFAWPDREYRGFGLPFLLSDPYHGYALSFDAAFARLAPEVVLVNPYLLSVLSSADQVRPLSYSRRDFLWTYLRDHRAELVAELRDYAGQPVQVYQLKP